MTLCESGNEVSGISVGGRKDQSLLVLWPQHGPINHPHE